MMATTDSLGYDTPENVPTIIRRPRYINIAADGLLDLPPHLRNIINEFEQLYENTRYKRLQHCGRLRSLEGVVDGRGNPIYDRLQRKIFPTFTCQGNTCSQSVQTPTVKKEHKHCNSVDLGELPGFFRANQGQVMGTVEHNYKRRFSVDLGHLREFIAQRNEDL